MDVGFGHILIDSAIKSVVIVGVPSLITGLSFRRHFSACERFTIMLAGVTTLLVLTIATLIAAGVSSSNTLLADIVVFAPNLPDTSLAIVEAIWMAVALPLLILTSVKILIGEWQCIKRTSQRLDVKKLPYDFEINRPVIVDEKCVSPCVKGVLFQRVFLPYAFMEWPEEDQRNILLHESFHLRRRDVFWRCVTDFAFAIFWFNPLIWCAQSRICLEQEISCDNGVLTTGVDRVTYSETILRVATDRRKKEGLATSIGMSGHLESSCVSNALARIRMMEVLQTWNNTFHLRCRILSIIDPAVCRRSLGMLTHVFLFSVVASITSFAFYYSLFNESVSVAEVVVIERSINATIDDAEEKVATGSVSLDSRDLEICMDFGQGWRQIVGLRFSELMIPQNATIVSAKIVFTSYNNGAGSNTYQDGIVESKIFVQTSPNAEPFRTTKRNISTRLQAEQRCVDWTIDGPWSQGQSAATTSELKDLIQPLVENGEWKPGNAIVFIIKTDAFEYARSAAAYDNTKSFAPPKLRLSYQLND